MGSMNWLGFSLSPQHVQAAAAAAAADPSISEEGNDHHHDIDQSTTCTALVSRLGFNYSDEISGTDVSSADCFDLMTTSDHHNTIDHDDSATTTTAPNDNNSHHSLYGHLPPSFGMLHQATFNTNNNNIHSQVGGGDWNMKSSSDSSNYYKMSSSNSTSSDHHMQLSMLMGTTNDSCMLDHQNHHQQPKLENFLGRHSFADHHQDHMIETASTISSTPHAAYNNNSNNNINNNNSSSNIGLSMIKTWLRNQPAPPHQQEKKKDINVQTGSLSLSMTSTSGSLRTHTTSSAAAASAGGETCSSDGENNKQAIITATPSGIGSSQINTSSATAAAAIEAVPRKSIDTFGQRTSIYRGVTRHRWTGRYEAHLWDNSCRREGQTRKGRQVYLGGYDKEEKAARAYDLAALKYWGTTTTTNFPISTYEKEVDEMKHMTRQEYVASLRRKSSGFSRGASMYRGVTRHHQHGRWQARIGRVAGNKDLYLGTFGTQEEAAEAYDIAAIKFRGLNAVTNFDMSRYDVKSILESSTLPIGGAAKRLKDVDHHRHQEMTLLVDHGNNRSSSTLTDHDNMMMMHGSTSTTAACHENDHHQQQLMMSSSTTSTDHHNSGGGGGGGGWPTTLALINQQAAAAAAHHHHHNYHHGIGMQYYYSPSSPSSYGQRVWCKQEQDTTSSTQSFYQQQQQQDHQLPQLGSSHNFFQPAAISAAAGLNMNLMTRTSTDSLEHSSGSNSVIYGTSTAATGEGGGSDHHGGYIIPMATCVDVINNGYEDGSENVYGSSTTSGTSTTRDHQHAYNPARNHLYYLPVLPLVHGPQSSSLSSVGVVNDHDQDNQQGQAAAGSSSAYNNCNWVPTAVPTNNINMAPAALFHGTSSTPTFTVWNDT